MLARIDWMAAGSAAAAGLAVLVPGAAVSGLVAERAGRSAVWLFLVVILAGFGLVGVVAGRQRNDTPMLHGAVGTALAFVVALVVGLLAAAVRDRSISLVAVPLAALGALTAGVAGALLADAHHRRAARHERAGG